MFNIRRDDVLPLLGLCKGHTFYGMVICFCSAGSEYDLLRICIDELGNLGACIFHGLHGRISDAVLAHWVPKAVLLYIIDNGLSNLRMERITGNMVQIDYLHSFFAPFTIVKSECCNVGFP